METKKIYKVDIILKDDHKIRFKCTDDQRSYLFSEIATPGQRTHVAVAGHVIKIDEVIYIETEEIEKKVANE